MVVEDVIFVTVELGYLLCQTFFEIFDADGTLFGQTGEHSFQDVERQLLKKVGNLLFVDFFGLVLQVLLVPLPDEAWD